MLFSHRLIVLYFIEPDVSGVPVLNCVELFTTAYIQISYVSSVGV